MACSRQWLTCPLAIGDQHRGARRLSGVSAVLTGVAAVLLALEVQHAQAGSPLDPESNGKAEGPAASGAATPEPKEYSSISLPGGHLLQPAPENGSLVTAAMDLLNSTRGEVKHHGYRDSSVTILFSPPREIPLTFGGPSSSKSETVKIGRLIIDVHNVLGAAQIVAEIDGTYRSFTEHRAPEWIAFRRELDRLTFQRPRPIVPAVGEWSAAVNGLRARLTVDNWRDPIIRVYLELQNVGNLVSTVMIPLDAKEIRFELRNQDGKPVAQCAQNRSGIVTALKDFRLPFDSSLKFNLSVTTMGFSGSDNAVIALREDGWEIRAGDFSPYQLSASFGVERDLTKNGTVWHGELQVPPVTIQPAPRERAPDPVVSRSYDVNGGQRLSNLQTLSAIFQSEQDVSFEPGREDWQIEVTAVESQQGFIGEVITAVGSGSPGELLAP